MAFALPANESCYSCGMLPSQCSCAPIPNDREIGDVTAFNLSVTTNSNGFAAGGGNGSSWSLGTYSGTGCTPGALSFPNQQPIEYWQSLQAPVCTDHTVDEAAVSIVDDMLVGSCSICAAVVRMPVSVAKISFEKAGKLIGRAMTLEEDDDEHVGELLAELKLLEDEVQRGQTKYKRALSQIRLARSLAIGRAATDNAPIG